MVECWTLDWGVVGSSLTSDTALHGRSQRLYHVEAHQKMENWGYFTFQIAKALIRVHGYAGWSAPLLFACNSQGFSNWGPYDVEAQAPWLRACIVSLSKTLILCLVLVQTTGPVLAQSVTCLATYGSLTADPGVASSTLGRSHTLVEIDREIISMVILLPSAESFKRGCCQLQAKECAQSTG